jgi:hypothetical protein
MHLALTFPQSPSSMESTPRYPPSFDVQPREIPEARTSTPGPPPEHYRHEPVEANEVHPEMASTSDSEQNSAFPLPADHMPNIDEQQPAIVVTFKEESRAKQRSLRQWTKQHKGTIGTIIGLYFVSTFESRFTCICIGCRPGTCLLVCAQHYYPASRITSFSTSYMAR